MGKTKPKLTQEMLDGHRAPPPGAGGWTPSKATVNAIGAAGVMFGAMVPVLPAAIPGRVGIALGASCGAIAGGLVYFATKSAGPRSRTE